MLSTAVEYLALQSDHAPLEVVEPQVTLQFVLRGLSRTRVPQVHKRRPLSSITKEARKGVRFVVFHVRPILPCMEP
jgi:hypothetical protein